MSTWPEQTYSVVEICAGAGGQSLGLHKAGFRHELAVELDVTAASTLENNLGIPVTVGDVADSALWDPRDYEGVTLFAGGVPCPPFSVAGKQLGTSDERDLFAWAIEQVGVMRPRAVMLENVRGLSSPRFSAYRQRVLDRLAEWGYVGEWRLILASDYGVPQLRPRFVLLALQPEDLSYLQWPEPLNTPATVGDALHDLMAADGWVHADEWRELAQGIGPTLVGGSKKHGGADLGPTRAREGWRKLYVDGRGIADTPPPVDAPSARAVAPRLTVSMAARVQGWLASDEWDFAGRKTSQYRQIGNAFPPPVAQAIGTSIMRALRRDGTPRVLGSEVDLHDPIYRALVTSKSALSIEDLLRVHSQHSTSVVEQKLTAIQRDFHVEIVTDEHGTHRYKLGEFRGFVGQSTHRRHAFVQEQRSRVS